MTKSVNYLFVLSFIFLSCVKENAKDSIKLSNSDTVNFENGYKAILNNKNELIKIIKVKKKDTLCVFFFNNEIREEISDENRVKKYFISNKHGIYKIKQFMYIKRIGLYQNQVIYIDTLCENFNISNNSNYINMDYVKDTVSLNEVVRINIKQKRQVFSKFKIYIQYSDSMLDLEYDNVLKAEEYDNKNGYLDVLKFNKKGDYYYQGFIENYSSTDSARPSIVTFFKKKIHVK